MKAKNGKAKRATKRNGLTPKDVAVHLRMPASMRDGLSERGAPRGEKLSETIRRVLADYLEARP